MDAVADRFLVGKFMPKLLSGGGLFTRVAKGATAGVAAEVPTEIGQQMLERIQAGKDPFSEEAGNEYLEVGVAAGLLGGTVKSTGQVVFGKREKSKTQELNDDITLQNAEAIQRQKNYQAYKDKDKPCLLYTSPSPRDGLLSRMPSSA